VDTPTRIFPDDLRPDETGLVGWGADLSEATLLEAYGRGLFPWSGEPPIPWYSPNPRLILDPGAFRASRSLKKLARRRRHRVTMDTAFREVMTACSHTPRPGQDGTWISASMIDAYEGLHRRHVAHSVEVWEDQELVGGLYGLTLGAAFFGESMFSVRPNSSKLALMTLCEQLARRGFHFVDCQQDTDHLKSLGAHTVSRTEYERLLREALVEPAHHESWEGWARVLV
jgi:leucyl/phenylalanyl-tRNA--protein transferase